MQSLEVKNISRENKPNQKRRAKSFLLQGQVYVPKNTCVKQGICIFFPKLPHHIDSKQYMK